MSAASLFLGGFALASFVLLLAVLLWPSRKRQKPTPIGRRWHPMPDDPDIRLRDFQMDEWRAGRRSAPPCERVRAAARDAEDRLIRGDATRADAWH